MDDQIRLRLAEDVTFQSMGQGEDTVVLSLATGSLFTCNGTTTELLAAMDGKRTFAEIIEALSGEFDVPQPKLRSDLGDIATKLIDEGLVICDA